jgi:hypothetical protein
VPNHPDNRTQIGETRSLTESFGSLRLHVARDTVVASECPTVLAAGGVGR